jgi:hypothetical protein
MGASRGARLINRQSPSTKLWSGWKYRLTCRTVFLCLARGVSPRSSESSTQYQIPSSAYLMASTMAQLLEGLPGR